MEKIVDFSDPVRTAAKQIIVTGPSSPAIDSLDDLAGQEIFVRKFSRYWSNLVRLNKKFRSSGKPEMLIKEADANLEDGDLLNMVNAGTFGITLMDDLVAGLWEKVFEHITIHKDLQVGDDDKIGWAVQKNTPGFLRLVNQFVREHKEGTSFGNTLIRRYLKKAKWAKNNTKPSEMKKFRKSVAHFKKYGAKYDFDWLLIAAQAYQESGIDQTRRSRAGAVGVMQIKPSTAADKSVNIKNVDINTENNIHAGIKYMNFIMDRYFKGVKMNRFNRALFAFASYNAGPTRVAKFRRRAAAEGLDPNIWFNNVEIIASKEIGSETVTYVSNIYKYYLGYKFVVENIVAPKNQLSR